MAGKIACLTPIKHIKSVWESLASLGEIQYHPYATYDEATILCASSEIVFVNPNKMTYRLDERLLSQSTLKYIVTASTGINHIDVKYAKEKNIKVISLTHQLKITEKISSTAEHALALTLSLIRKIPWGFESVKNHHWNYEPFIGRQIDHLAVGVIGYGRLGKKYKKYMDGLGAETLVYDPYVTYKNKVSLINIQEHCDIISLHVHISEETRHMVNYDFMHKCTKRPYLINTSRGEIVDENDVLKALDEELISGYAADVLEHELYPQIVSPLIEASKSRTNILLTPHIGGMTTEAQEIAYNGVVNILRIQLTSQ